MIASTRRRLQPKEWRRTRNGDLTHRKDILAVKDELQEHAIVDLGPMISTPVGLTELHAPMSSTTSGVGVSKIPPQS